MLSRNLHIRHRCCCCCFHNHWISVTIPGSFSTMDLVSNLEPLLFEWHYPLRFLQLLVSLFHSPSFFSSDTPLWRVFEHGIYCMQHYANHHSYIWCHPPQLRILITYSTLHTAQLNSTLHCPAVCPYLWQRKHNCGWGKNILKDCGFIPWQNQGAAILHHLDN